MLIQYKIKNVYGADKFYPANANAEMICRLKNQKTLTQEDLRILSSNLSITVEHVKV